MALTRVKRRLRSRERLPFTVDCTDPRFHFFSTPITASGSQVTICGKIVMIAMVTTSIAKNGSDARAM